MSNTASLIEELKNLQCAANMNNNALSACVDILAHRKKYAQLIIVGNYKNDQEFNYLADMVNVCDELLIKTLGINRTPLQLRK